jgi:DNA mismatch repair ATPase MutS
MKNFLLDFQKSIFKEFISYKLVWNETIEIVSELDALISLSKYSYSGPYIIPQFVESKLDVFLTL